jgi:hypothetical protein
MARLSKRASNALYRYAWSTKCAEKRMVRHTIPATTTTTRPVRKVVRPDRMSTRKASGQRR